ncbi:hypothetical protein [Acidovorax sp. Leaf73]|uniref:hypothetical protein n=1 Tax=Acidovorax sp. Leaf73 TaxID=2876566 RepID=UPI001E5CF5B2|nr:hypothetical protein [Acidovorax sp. Leaf73]
MQVQMPAARRLAQLPDQYAGGGLVARMKSADAGPAAFGARGLSQLRDMVPKVAAMGYPQQAAVPAPAPAPVSNPRAAQLMAMIPQMEAMGFKQKPQMLARGGMVRGPGTGTSDSIPDEAEPGTYIMPADSTAAIGPSALEKMGTVPVRLSDGEFKIPPEQVMALGAAVLKLYKDATHTPVNGEDGGQTDAEVEGDDDDGARGFNPADRMAQMPEQMFADGGMVDPNRPNSFGDAAAAARDPGVTQIGAGYQPANGRMSVVPSQPRPAPAPAGQQPTTVNVANPAWQRMAAAPSPATPAAAPMGWQARQDQRSADVGAASITNRPEWRRYADGGMVEDDLQKRLMQIPSSAPPGWTGGGGGSGGGGGAGGVTGSWEAPQAAPAPAPAPTQPAGALTRAAGAGRGFVNPDPITPAAQAMGSMPNNAVTRTGNSYTGSANISGDITVNGQAPGGGAISAQNMAAADSLARRGAADAMASMPAPQQTNVQAPMVRHSGNDWQARNDLRNALVSASSITNNGGRFDQTRGRNPAALAYQSALATDNALQASEPGLAAAAMKENSETNRSSMRERGLAAQALASERGAMDRTLITERGNNTRAGITALASTEAARLRAQQEGKAPPGYRFTANGNMEAIPGGPADLRQNKEGVQQGKDTQDIFSILNEARPLMANATGSYGGVALDKVAQTFGAATDGAKATAQLQALQGALVSKMPKMSGPQSDKDVQLYREMAGQIGDPTIPREQRKAAMDTIESLNIKYLPAVTDAAGYDAVPSGSYYKTPSGDVRRKQ